MFIQKVLTNRKSSSSAKSSIRVCLCFVIMLFSLSDTVQSEEGNIIIVANSSVVSSDISVRDLRRIYLGKMKKWKNGDRIKVAQLKKGDVPERFSRYIMEKPHNKYKIYWKRVVAAGTGIPPKSLKTEKDLLDYVKKTDGAIGYVGELKDHEGIIILHISE